MRKLWLTIAVVVACLTCSGTARAQTPDIQRMVDVTVAVVRLSEGVDVVRSTGVLALNAVPNPVRLGEEAGAYVRRLLFREDD